MDAPDGPFYDNRVHVLARKCSTCIFRPGNKMHLEDGRVEEMIESSVEAGGVIACHDTIHRDDGVRRAICRGFYDVHGMRVWLLRLAKLMGVVTFVAPPPPHPLNPVSRRREDTPGADQLGSAGTGPTLR